MVRYPHSGAIRVKTEATYDSNGNLLQAYEERNIRCRVEMSDPGLKANETGRVYTRLNEIPEWTKHQNNGEVFVYDGKQYLITQGNRLQSHIEIIIQ